MPHPIYRVVGILVWLTLGIYGYTSMRGPIARSGGTSPGSLTDYVLRPTTRVTAVDPTGRLRSGDPIFQHIDHNRWRQVGHVVASSAADDTVTLSWYAARRPSDFDLVQYYNRGRLEDVVATMLPPSKRERLQQQLAEVLQEHGEEMSRMLTPLVQQSLRESVPVIEEELARSVQRHRDEIDALAERWNEEIVQQRIIPMARREIMPIVREHGEPTAQEIGRELWDRASLWRFGWRAAYDRSPLPRRNLVQEEWDRFVDEEAIPVFEEHMDDIVHSVQQILADVAANSTVRRELADVASEMVSDSQTRELFRTILRESILENDALRDVWRNVWSSDQARVALARSSQRLEPVVRKIGDEIFGTREGGIDPNFARVLRSQILGKDRRWIVARDAAGRSLPASTGERGSEPIRIEPSSQRMPYPVVYLADREPEARHLAEPESQAASEQGAGK